MSPKDYIVSELESFIKVFPKVRVRYEYDEMAIVHTIEVLPNEIYHLDEEYLEWERRMFHSFIDRYPTENIGFITDDALVGIENPIFIKKGLDYDLFSSIKAIVTFNNDIIIVEGVTAEKVNVITFDGNKIESDSPPKDFVDHNRSLILAA